MTNKTFEPMGLVDITREITKLNRNRKRLDDMTDRLQSALDAKRDLQGQVASDYANQLDFALKRNQGHWQNGYDAGYSEGYANGWKAGSLTSTEPTSEERDRELLESHGIDVEPLFANVQKIIADHETGSTTSHEQDIDEDEPDQYPPEPEKWGGTK